MTVTCYAAPAKRRSLKWCQAFAKGCGGAWVEDGQLRDGPAALYGKPELWHLFEAVRRDGRDWWYGDNGYFGRRLYRVTRGAVQHSGVGPGDHDRLRRLGVEVRPWRRGGRHVLICPPGSVYGRLNGFDAAGWLAWARTTLARFTDRPIRVRPKSDRARRPLAADLEDAHALVACASNAAVEALCQGVPVFVTKRCAATALASGPLARIETPATPDGREDWAACLAANQWTLQEIADGDCWRAIGVRDQGSGIGDQAVHGPG